MQEGVDGVSLEVELVLKVTQEDMAHLAAGRALDEGAFEQIVHVLKAIAGAEMDAQLLEPPGR